MPLIKDIYGGLIHCWSLDKCSMPRGPSGREPEPGNSRRENTYTMACEQARWPAGEGPSMPTWGIVLSSAIGGIVLATALAVAEGVNAPRSGIGTILIPHLPVLAVGALCGYGLGAMLLKTINFVASLILVRHHLGGGAPWRT